MEYHNYCNARDMAWRLLIENKVGRLPVKISAIAEAYGIQCLSYKKGERIINSLGLSDHCAKTDGFTVQVKYRKLIFYNEQCSRQRCRFTIAHELGHHFLGHILAPCIGGHFSLINREPSPADTEDEHSANVFAGRILAPACVLWGLGVQSSGEIAQICDISQTGAEFRLTRLRKLYERNEEFKKTKGYGCFLLSSYEQQVYLQFQNYIEEILQI